MYFPLQLELITSKGYPGEAHWVQTPDGYILGLHRIPHGKGQQKGQWSLASTLWWSYKCVLGFR